MFIVMGGTGNVGGAVARTLLAQGQPVAIVTRTPGKATHWIELGAQVLEADVLNPTSLRAAFRKGKRAFLLKPPADPTHDTDAVERQTVGCILEAMKDSGLEKVVAASTAGAQAGDRIGDLNVLWELEQGIARPTDPCSDSARSVLHAQLGRPIGDSPRKRTVELHDSGANVHSDGLPR